jgi:predicted nucleic acid-binding protein
MSDRVFIDTNILIYLYSEDEPEKRRKSIELLDANSPVISTQVINEFVNTLRRKFSFEYDAIYGAIQELAGIFTVIPQSMETIVSAIQMAKRYGYSYFDSLIIASALESNCEILYTEDLQHSQLIEDRLTITNPFV